MPEPLRVLCLAEACNPRWSSVPLVGYNMVRALAARDDLALTVCSHVRNEEALRADPLAGRVRLELIDSDVLAGPRFKLGTLLRGGKGLSWTTNMALSWPGYMLFEELVHRRLGRELAAGAFDLVHRVTPVSISLGSPLARRSPVPMLIGPLNGGLPWPKEFPELRVAEKEWLAPLRRAYRWLPWFRATWRHAAGAIVGSRSVRREIPASFPGRLWTMAENGIDPARFPIAEAWTPPRERFQIVTVGRLVPLKAFDILLEAFAALPAEPASELILIGEGPERSRLETLITRLGLNARARITGWLEQSALQKILRGAQLFAFPSLREFGGGVVLEAMACALPCIVMEYGGPGELVDESCGLRLPMAPRDVLRTSLRDALATLLADPQRCRRLGGAAAAKVRRDFTWDVKAERLRDIYRVLTNRE